MSGAQGMHLMRAEAPGPSVGKLVSRMRDTAKILYGIYLVMTVVLILLLLAGGMSLFDSCIHAFGTAGTGGFSSRNASVGAYDSVYFDVIISVFMLLFGVNFNLYYFLLIKRFRDVFRSEELRAYLAIVATAVIVIAVNISHMYDSFWTGLRHALFQVSTIITTTGYATTDFNLWPSFSKTVLVLLMFIGACAGSTGGGMKVSRWVILSKASYSDMRQMLHPNSVSVVRFEGKPVPEKTLRGIHLYLTVYVLVYAVSMLLLSLEGFDMTTTFTAVTACINNIGPGLEMVGPMGNFSAFSAASKLLLSFDMLAGRLELFPMLLLFAPSIWRRGHKVRPRIIR
jgi:trk system potassium uptake protein TrkH